MTQQKAKRTKKVSEDDLLKIFEKLSEMETAFLNEVKLFFQMNGQNGKTWTMDFFTAAIINRSISLIKGFVTLAKENNYISSVPLIRIQLDNCLRFYAATLVADYNIFFTEYLKGTHIGNLKDASGRKMTDTYLVTKLEKVFPGVHNLYINSSGHVHFSNVHSFVQTKLSKDKERTIGIRIGSYDFYSLDKKVDFAFNMYIASKILLELTSSWKIQKLKNENGPQKCNCD